MFRFSIRELILLTTIAGLAMGWIVSYRQMSAEVKRAQEERGVCYGSAEKWRKIALEFGHLMRKDGWYVTVKDNGMGHGYTHRKNISQETADQLNSSAPLASPDTLLVLPDY